MAIEHELATLRTLTAHCAMIELDAANSANAAVLVFPGGVTLRVSSTTAALIGFARANDDPGAIAARFAVREDALEVAVGQLVKRLQDTVDLVGRRQPTGFIAHRKLIAGARVARWVRPLTVLFAPWVACVLVAWSWFQLATVASGVVAAPRSSLALWSGFAIGLVLMFLHELGHAAACRRFGAQVGDIGCALYLIYPALYCDVTSTWALPRRARVVVDLGGVYFQLVATALLAFCWRYTEYDALAAAVRISCATMIFNLLPLGRLDGYWLLSDALGVIDLRAQQRVVVAALWKRVRRRSHAALPWGTWTTLAIASYAVASVWFVISIARTLLPQVVIEASLFPERLVDLASAVAAAHGQAALIGVGRLVSSGVIAWVAFALTRSLLRSSIQALRRRSASAP